MREPKSSLFSDTLAQARSMRGDPTNIERRLWRFLRDRRLAGAKFRRQHAVGPYIVDFFCAEAGLVVELDGGRHAEPEGRARDESRDRELRSMGLRVLRFWDGDVARNLDGVLRTIFEALAAPSTQPSPRGRGGGER